MAKQPPKPRSFTNKQADAFMEKNLRKFYPEVGRIVAVWSMFEWRMDQLIWDLAGVEQRLGACITTQLNGPTPRLRSIKGLVALLDAPTSLLQKINKFSHSIVLAQEARNRAVHDPWFVTTNQRVDKMVVAMIENRLVFEQKATTVEDVQAVLKLSYEVLTKFNNLNDEIRGAVAELSPETRRRLLARVSPRNEAMLGPNSDQLGRQPQRQPFPEIAIPSRKIGSRTEPEWLANAVEKQSPKLREARRSFVKKMTKD